MANPWFKFYGTEYLGDQKMLGLSACERSCWITLLCFAGQSGGVVKYLTEHQLMLSAGVNFQEDEWGRTEGVLETFEKLGMVTISNDQITILNWGKRQEKSLTNAERQAKFRERHNTKVTDSNESVTLDKNRTDKNRTDISFEKFWDAFPKKIAKKQAEKAFKKINPAELPAILQDISRRKKTEDWQKKDGQFIPYPATYLNNERWKDELITPKADPPRNCKICGRPVKNWIQSGSGVVCHDCNASPPKRNEKLEQMKSKTLTKT